MRVAATVTIAPRAFLASGMAPRLALMGWASKAIAAGAGPVWQIVPTITFVAGQRGSFDLSPYISDPEKDPLYLSIASGNLPPGVTQQGMSLVYDGIGAAGSSTVALNASDTPPGTGTAPPPASTPPAPLPSSGLTYLGAFQLGQVKFGRRVPWLYNPSDKKLYTIGGEVWQATNSNYTAGSGTLFKYDAAAKTLEVASPYWGASGVQPAHPDGVALMYDTYTGAGANVVVLPGTTGSPAQFGGWQGGSSALQGRVMRWADREQKWYDVMPKPAAFPAPALATSFLNDSGNDHCFVVTRYNGSLVLIDVNTYSGNVWVVPVTGADFQSMDPGELPQFYDACFFRVICYDWQQGRLVAVARIASGNQASAASLIAKVPALAAKTDPFAMAFDAPRFKAVLFFKSGIQVVDLYTGAVTSGGPLPAGVTGFYSAVYDSANDLIVATGQVGGSAHMHHYRPASLPDPQRPIPQAQWHDLNVSRAYFNYVRLWRWKNPGGDWTDASGVAQGTTAFAVTTPIAGANQWVSADITSLYKKWAADGNNNGLALRDTRDSKFYGRKASDPALRPHLQVTTSNGTVICPCTDSSVASGDSNAGVLPHFDASAHCALLKFDLSGVKGTVSSVLLKFYCMAYYGGSVQGKIFRVATPVIRELGSGAPQRGLAATFPRDQGINTWAQTNTNVLFAMDFSAGWEQRWGRDLGFGHDGVISDPQLQAPALRIRFPAYRRGGSGRVLFAQIGRPNQEEAYFRVYAKFEKDFLPRLGGKLGFSWDWRMGSNCGNGGAGCTGLKEPTGNYGSYTVDVASNRIVMRPASEGEPVTFIYLTPPPGIKEGQVYYARNPSGNSFQLSASPTGALITLTGPRSGRSLIWFNRRTAATQLCGGSERAMFLRCWPPDPYSDFISVGQYSYHAGVRGYGDNFIWGDPARGYGVFRREKWYCVEGYMKMNTISGPFDSLGNGTGNADGITRYWVNGVLEFEKTDNLFRHHPDMKLMGYWSDWVYGGTNGTQAEHHVRLANLVIAKTYIGPMG